MGHDRTVSFTLDTNLVMIKENPEGHPSCTIAGRWCAGQGRARLWGWVEAGDGVVVGRGWRVGGGRAGRAKGGVSSYWQVLPPSLPIIPSSPTAPALHCAAPLVQVPRPQPAHPPHRDHSLSPRCAGSEAGAA
jgi:hypothetical protein